MEAHYDGGRSETPPTELQVIVCDLLRHRLHQERLEWDLCPIPVTSPNRNCRALRRLVDDFRSRYEEHFQQMFDGLELERDPVQAEEAYLGIVSELFREGIKWSYIVALFVLSGEFSFRFATKRWTEMLNLVMNWTVSYINTRLNTWIQEHGGWDYMVRHYEEEEQDVTDSTWPRLKHLVCGVAAGALGVLTLKAILASKS